VQQKVKVGKTVCDEASVVPWEVHFRDKVQRSLPKRAIGDFQRGPTWWTSKRSATHQLMVVPRHSVWLSTVGRRAFAMQGSTVWNSLPDDLRAQQDCVLQTGLDNLVLLQLLACTAH